MPIEKRGNRWHINFSYNRQRIRRPSPDNSPNGAKAFEALIRQRLARGEPLEEPKKTPRVLFKDFALQWLEDFVRVNNKHSEFISRSYTVKSSLTRYFGPKNINQITSHDIERYKIYLLKDRGLSPKTINNQLSILSKCLKTAVEWKLLDVIPKIQLLKVPPQSYCYLSSEESYLLLRSAKGQLYEMILLGLNTGLRFGEIIGLKWGNINFQENLLKVTQTIVQGKETSPKSNKIRTVSLNAEVLSMFLAKEKTGTYIFEGNNGVRLQHSYCIRALQKLCREIGIKKIGWHALRHTFASRLGENNVPITDIKQLLGHSDIKTTMRYVHTNLASMQAAVKTLEAPLI